MPEHSFVELCFLCVAISVIFLLLECMNHYSYHWYVLKLNTILLFSSFLVELCLASSIVLLPTLTPRKWKGTLDMDPDMNVFLCFCPSQFPSWKSIFRAYCWLMSVIFGCNQHFLFLSGISAWHLRKMRSLSALCLRECSSGLSYL